MAPAGSGNEEREADADGGGVAGGDRAAGGDGASTAAHRSVWLDESRGTTDDPLASDVHVQTAVVGAGIVGASGAFGLSAAGQRVALLERDRVGTGVTGHSTAKLTAQHGLVYRYLADAFGTSRARQYATANQRAIDTVESRAGDLGIDCDFERTAAYVYTRSPAERDEYRAEADTAAGLGLPATYTESLPPSLSGVAAVRFDDQARFDPHAYVAGLVDRVAGDGNVVAEETTVTDVQPGTPCEVGTDRGTVRADDVVVASHFPVYDRAGYFARLYPKRSYVLALRLADDPPTGMYYRPGEPYFSVRPHPTDDASTVLVGGQNHRTGHGHEDRRYRRLEAQARAHFDVEAVTHRWSTQDYVSVDRVPVVGAHSPLSEHVYVASGFGGWGLSNGTAAGELLRDLVLGTDCPWSDVYDPTRRPVARAVSPFLDHGKHAAKHTVMDTLSTEPPPSDVSLAPDDAAVVDGDDGPVAVYRDPDGGLHAVSAVCTHQGCHVHWNDGERTWDCPCHGSRFAVDGRVLDTPAVADLGERDPPPDVESGD